MSRAARALASVLAGGAALAPGGTAPRVAPPRPPHTQPASLPAPRTPPGASSQPGPRLSLEQRAYRAIHRGPHDRTIARAANKGCQPFAVYVLDAERIKGLPRHTLTALGFIESRCDPRAENKRTRARGWSQFVPSGAAAVGRIQRARGDAAPWFSYRAALDPVASIYAAAELLAYALDTCGSLPLALGMYGSGKCNGAPSFAIRVLRLAEQLRSLELKCQS